jgi:hypothetical protein
MEGSVMSNLYGGKPKKSVFSLLSSENEFLGHSFENDPLAFMTSKKLAIQFPIIVWHLPGGSRVNRAIEAYDANKPFPARYMQEAYAYQLGYGIKGYYRYEPELSTMTPMVYYGTILTADEFLDEMVNLPLQEHWDMGAHKYVKPVPAWRDALTDLCLSGVAVSIVKTPSGLYFQLKPGETVEPIPVRPRGMITIHHADQPNKVFDDNNKELDE